MKSYKYLLTKKRPNGDTMSQALCLLSSLDNSRLVLLLRDSIRGRRVPRERLAALKAKLQQGQVVEPAHIPRDVITMNSTVSLLDLDTEVVETCSLVYPGFANIVENCVSVLAVLGVAILGQRVGDIVVWESPTHFVRTKVEDLVFQPEREGRFDV